MNFNIEDLIKRIEQLEANTVNNASVYELTKTIDKISTRLEGIEALAKGAASSKAFAPIINEIKNEMNETKSKVLTLVDAQKADKKELADSVFNIAKSLDYNQDITEIKEAVSFQSLLSKKLESKINETIKPIEKIERVVDSARRTYGEELSSFTLKTNKKLEAINKIIGVSNGE